MTRTAIPGAHQGRRLHLCPRGAAAARPHAQKGSCHGTYAMAHAMAHTLWLMPRHIRYGSCYGTHAMRHVLWHACMIYVLDTSPPRVLRAALGAEWRRCRDPPRCQNGLGLGSQHAPHSSHGAFMGAHSCRYTAPSPGVRLEDAPASFFAGAALGGTGRFGSYAAPQITSVTGGAVGSAPAKGWARMFGRGLSVASRARQPRPPRTDLSAAELLCVLKRRARAAQIATRGQW